VNPAESLPQVSDKEAILDALLKKPTLTEQIMQLLQVHATPA